MGIVPSLLLGAVFFGFPALFIAMIASHVAPRVSSAWRAIFAAFLPAVLYFPISYKIVLSEGTADERLIAALVIAGIQIAIGFPIALLKSREKPAFSGSTLKGKLE